MKTTNRIPCRLLGGFRYAIVALLVLAACSKDQLMEFGQAPQVYIYKQTDDASRDSATYSFAIQLPETVQDTFRIPIRISGVARDVDRTVHYEVLDRSTADADLYEILPARIPAGSYTGFLPIRLIKKEVLAQQEMRLWIKIVPSADFEPGAADQLEYLLKVNNYLTRPPSWVQGYFGDFSQVKYGMIIRETGYTDFTGTLPAVWYYIIQSCKNAMLEYKASTGQDMVDELGNNITFPF